MIKQTFDYNIFFEVCDKLKEAKNIKLTANILYTHMLVKDTFTYVSYDNEIMNGCLVLKLFKDVESNMALLMLFVWFNAHYPKLLKEFKELSINKAKELKATKIYFVSNRNEKAIERRTGFKKVYTTYMKEVI